jgi:hypothetical protein
MPYGMFLSALEITAVWTPVVENRCYQDSGTCTDHYEKRSIREHDAFFSVYVVICVCFKADSDFPDPNVERSVSLRYPAKGEFELFFFFFLNYLFMLFPVASIFPLLWSS